MLHFLRFFTVVIILFCWQVPYGQLLEGYGIIQGIVYDADGLAIDSALVSAWEPDADTTYIDSTDLQGRYTLTIPLGDYQDSDTVYVHAEKDDYIPSDIIGVVVAFMEIDTLNFLLLTHAISGTVTDEVFQEVLEGVHVFIVDINGDTIYSDYTDSQGDYTLEEVDPGIYDVSFRFDEYLDLDREGINVIEGVLCTLDVAMDRIMWYVDTTGNDDAGRGTQENPFASIGKACGYSSTGDTVIVRPGTYIGSRNKNIFISKQIVIESTHGPGLTIIDCEADIDHQHRAFRFLLVDSLMVLDGFTIINGFNTLGAGIWCYPQASPKIINCIIKNNIAEGSGAAMHIWDHSHPIIRDCEITGNMANDGAGIFADINSSPTIEFCLIGNNIASGGGGGILCDRNSHPTILNCTITGNSAGMSGSGIYCLNNDPDSIQVELKNCILWGDTPDEIDTSSSNPVVEYCDVQGDWEGEGNINCNPMFCNPDIGNYYLDSASCCVGAGEGGVDIGAFGIGCGVGFTCEYIPGDINGNGEVRGSDVTYGVRYFKGEGSQPPDSCWNDSTSSWFYSGGDCNGDCEFLGADITYLKEFLKGNILCVDWCPQTPPTEFPPHVCPPEEPIIGIKAGPVIRNSY
jgi:hypothetical protein